MTDAVVTLSDKPPPPPRADFAFEIDFLKGEGPASRIFAATHEFIRACERLDAELVRSIDSNIQTVMVLEDIQVGSIRTWLRNLLSATDDDALKTLDWKPQVGRYLVRAKYAAIRWLDEEGPQRTLPALRNELQKIAAETDVRHLPDYAPPSPSGLIEAIGAFQAVKDSLLPGDRALLVTPDGEIEMKLEVRISIEDLESLAVARTLEIPAAEMILPVKKPDYLGSSMWELRHGKRNIEARIEDEAWLKRFQSRQVDVRPGDALRCLVRIEYLYGHDNELLTERYTVLQILEVLVDRFQALELPYDNP